MAKPQQRRQKEKKSRSKHTPQYEDFKDVVIDARKFLKGNGDVDLDSELEFDDEELDSDEAWGEDEYDVLDNTFSQTTRDQRKKNGKPVGKPILKSSQVNEFGEDEDEGWSSVEEGELITLSEAWDRDDKELKDIEKEKAKKSKKNELVLNEEDDDDEEEESEESEESSEDESDEDPFDEMNISDSDNELGNVLSNLSKHLPKEEKERKVLINDKTSESQFALPTEGDDLGFDDMLLDDADDETAVELLQSNKSEQRTDEAEERDYHGQVIQEKSSGAYAIPLPARIQKRQERRAAYEIQREDVSKWNDVVSENREKEVLDFRPAVIEQNPMAAFTPSEEPGNELESKLDSILKQSNLEEKKTEDLFNNIQTAKMSKADMIKRTKELRMMRELMYRNERDAKRLKKIKSKSFRKQLRKDKDKEHAMMEGLEENEDAEDGDYLRAKERMTLKHKNTSNWAKSLIKSGISKDKESREEMEEMMRRSELLRQKQMGSRGSDDEEDDRGLSDIERDMQDEEQVDDEKLGKVGKGVLAMDFMKNAAERERLIQMKQLQDLKGMRETNGEELFLDNEDNGVNVVINNGRRVYTPSALVRSREANELDEEIMRENEEDDSRSLANRLKVKERVVIREEGSDDEEEATTTATATGDNSDDDDDEANPWLDNDDDDEPSGKKSSKVSVVDKNSKQGAKFQSRIDKDLEKQEAKSKKSKSKKPIDEVTIDTTQTLKLVDVKVEEKKKKKNSKKRAAAESDDEFEDDGGNGEDDVYMFKQEDLIKQAFAGDDLIQNEFIDEKEQVERMEDDKEVDESMPGWGDWAGTEGDDSWGYKEKRKKRKIIRKVQGVTSKSQRQDKGKEKVIINERVTKASMKYQADKIPYPFKTWEEYEKSLRMPLGKEWVSDSTFQKMTTPEVITRFGSVINPLKAPFK